MAVKYLTNISVDGAVQAHINSIHDHTDDDMIYIYTIMYK